NHRKLPFYKNSSNKEKKPLNNSLPTTATNWQKKKWHRPKSSRPSFRNSFLQRNSKGRSGKSLPRRVPLLPKIWAGSWVLQVPNLPEKPKGKPSPKQLKDCSVNFKSDFGFSPKI